MAREYKVISADSHLDLNPEVWTHRVPANLRDRAPKRMVMSNGSDGVVCDGGRAHAISLTSHTGGRFDEMPFDIPKFGETIGNGPPEQRVAEQDRDGIDAEVMFSLVESMFRSAKDDELYLALVRAYNDYMAEEFMAVAPDRLFSLGTIPTSGINDAVNELEHCKAVGFKGVNLTRFPSGHGYPSAEDDRFWAAALDLQIGLAQHGGGRFAGPKDEPTFLYPNTIESPNNHKADAINLLFSNNPSAAAVGGAPAYGAMQMAYAGVFDRFPKLQFYFAETWAAWIPFALFSLDDNRRRFRALMQHMWGLEDLEREPSEYLREHTFWGTLYDPVGVQGRAAIGADKLMFSTDFPHAASDWPYTQKVVEETFAGVPEPERHQMLAGNAIRYFHLND